MTPNDERIIYWCGIRLSSEKGADGPSSLLSLAPAYSSRNLPAKSVRQQAISAPSFALLLLDYHLIMRLSRSAKRMTFGWTFNVLNMPLVELSRALCFVPTVYHPLGRDVP